MNRSLQLPRIWEKDWAAAVGSAAGPLRRSLNAQRLLAAALKEFAKAPDSDPLGSATMAEVPLTSERLAWLALWSRTFDILEAFSRACGGPSALSLTLLARPAIELLLQLDLIADPVLAPPSVPPVDATPPEPRQEVLRRLRVFLVWGIEHDRAIAEQSSDETFLHTVFLEGAELDRHLAQDPDSRARSVALGIDLPEIVSPPEAALDRDRARQSLKDYLDTLQSYLSPDLVALQAQVRASTSPYFHKLFPTDKSRTTDHQRVRSLWGQIYKTENETTHGSTIFGSLLLTPYGAVPRIRSEEHTSELQSRF